ncbi:MAG: glycosyltransferase [Candidatus Saccharimonadales bacterium]
MKQPLVSVIVPTKNSSSTLFECLKSIVEQSYKHIEIIVVDNFSTDDTQVIAKRFTPKVYSKGPERSAQTNYGVTRSNGSYIYKVDSDFILDPHVIEECMTLSQEGYDAIVVHNSPDTRVSWVAKIRKFEVDMYKYDLNHSSARFVKKELYEKIGGFDPAVTAGEDYDFQNKLNRAGVKTAFANAEALHLGEPKTMRSHLLKYYSYGKDFINYQLVSQKSERSNQLGFFRAVYFKNWKKFLYHPFLGIAFIVYHCFKYLFGALGLLEAKLRQVNREK